MQICLFFLVLTCIASQSFVTAFQLNVKRLLGSAAIATGLFTGTVVQAADTREIGSISTSGLIFKDTLKINAFKDPKVEGVIIYLADFERPLTEKLQKNFFDDPSATALACSQSGPIKIGNVDMSTEGEEVFEANRSLFFKQIRVRRIYDKENNNLVYASFSTRLDKGDDANKSRFKSSICAVHINN